MGRQHFNFDVSMYFVLNGQRRKFRIYLQKNKILKKQKNKENVTKSEKTLNNGNKTPHRQGSFPTGNEDSASRHFAVSAEFTVSALQQKAREPWQSTLDSHSNGYRKIAISVGSALPRQQESGKLLTWRKRHGQHSTRMPVFIYWQVLVKYEGI